MIKDLKGWLMAIGIKRYLVAIVIILLIDISVIRNYSDFWTGEGFMFYAGIVMAHIAILGFNIGLAVHMIMGYKAWKKDNETGSNPY